MAHSRRFGSLPVAFGGPLTPAVKKLLIVNVAVFVVYFFAVPTRLDIEPLQQLFRALSLIPSWVVFGALWQPFTYLFLHDPYGFSHILFNMLTLWWFGGDLERDWGSRRFLKYYFFCGVGAGLMDVAARFFFGGLNIPTIGASGAIYGVLLAFGLLYPDRIIYFALIFPLPARIFVFILGAIAFLSAFGAPGSAVSHVAHLGGMLFGYIYLRRRPRVLDVDWADTYRNWRLRRARRKFQVYMRDRNRRDWPSQ